ncbi:MAG: hypothetical protein EOP50_13610 [Sphingobacteriales bacterium]|nr:MAG: hypothetical protein EOP50_13610 [Sphingobacteriales bacterium]
MDQQKKNDNNGNAAPRETQVTEGGIHVKDIQPALEPKADERARTERSGEGDRTDTDEMRQVSKG